MSARSVRMTAYVVLLLSLLTFGTATLLVKLLTMFVDV